MKQCKKPECILNVFSHGYCKNHQYLRTDEKWIKSRNEKYSFKGFGVPYLKLQEFNKKRQEGLLDLGKRIGCRPSVIKVLIKRKIDFDKLKGVEVKDDEIKIIDIDTFERSILDNYSPIKGRWIIEDDNTKIKPETNLKDKTHKPSPIKRSSLKSKLTKRESYIKKQSQKGIARTRKIQAIKRKLIKQNGNSCFFTGPTTERLDAFHIFPQGKYPEYRTEEWNIILSTRKMNTTWDQGTWEEILQMPNIHWLLWFIQTKDNDPNKLHKGNFYNQLIHRKNK